MLLDSCRGGGACDTCLGAEDDLGLVVVLVVSIRHACRSRSKGAGLGRCRLMALVQHLF